MSALDRWTFISGSEHASLHTRASGPALDDFAQAAQLHMQAFRPDVVGSLFGIHDLGQAKTPPLILALAVDFAGVSFVELSLRIVASHRDVTALSFC